jgi:hypothetical protein
MPRPSSTVLNDFKIRATLKQAWEDSLPGITGGHEEGRVIEVGDTWEILSEE